NSFVLNGSVSIVFSGAGSLAADSYTLGSGAGTLFSLDGHTKPATFTSGSIAGAAGSALVFTTGNFLTVKPNKVLTLSNVNVDLTNAGSIVFGTASRLLITGGGSITTGAEAVNIAYDGVIAGSAANGGKAGVLLTGTLAENSPTVIAGSISAGSLGTLSLGNFITAGGSFAKVEGVLSGSLAQTLPTDGDGGSASTGGSILIFNEL
ncbi:MAG: hypothetical protein LBJ35_00250, partial [Spirochaetaceae bacterium]|nr:hypothetical protein [Spirochaetaceae bacterium]